MRRVTGFPPARATASCKAATRATAADEEPPRALRGGEELMGTFHHGKSELHGITVVVDTSGPEIYVGRCHDMDDEQVILNDVDVHRGLPCGHSHTMVEELGRPDGHSRVDLDAEFAEMPAQHLHRCRIGARKQLVERLEDVDLRPGLAEQRGKLATDDTATDDGDITRCSAGAAIAAGAGDARNQQHHR